MTVLEFPTQPVRLPTPWGTIAVSPRTILIASYCFICLLIFARILWSRRQNSRPSTNAYSATTVDFTNPNIDAPPVDLTKMGGDVELPDDHPLRKMNGVTPSALAPFHNKQMGRDEIAGLFSEIDLRLTKLEKG